MTHKVVVMSVSVREGCECLFDSNAPNLARRKISVNRREQITLNLGRCLSFLCSLRCIYLCYLPTQAEKTTVCHLKSVYLQRGFGGGGGDRDIGGRRVTPLTHEVSACHVRRQRWIWLANKWNQSVQCVCVRLRFWIWSLNLGHTRTIWKAVESFPLGVLLPLLAASLVRGISSLLLLFAALISHPWVLIHLAIDPATAHPSIYTSAPLCVYVFVWLCRWLEGVYFFFCAALLPVCLHWLLCVLDFLFFGPLL